MRNFLAILIVLLVYTTSLFVVAPEMIHITVIAEIFLNFVFHFMWRAKNKIYLATLPAAWALCVIPLSMFAFCFPWLDDFPPIPGSYIFMMFGGITVLPIFIISLLTSAVSYFMRWRSM